MKRLYFKVGFVLILILLFCTVGVIERNKTIQTSGNVGSTSNKKIGWGIKRNDNHEQPDLGTLNKKIIDEENGIAMGSNETKKVYLTFDNGYEAGYTSKILQVLKDNNVKACFFITAHYVNTSENLVRQMIEEGHIIGNHTVNHKCMPELSDEQIKKEVMELHTVVYEKFGYEMKYLRPPKGEYSQRVLKYCNSLGYTTVMWSFAYDDWNEKAQKGEEYAKKKILENVHNGEVLLLHATSKDNSNVLDYCIKEMKKMGYEFLPLEEFER